MVRSLLACYGEDLVSERERVAWAAALAVLVVLTAMAVLS